MNYTKTFSFHSFLDFEIADEGLWTCNFTHFLTYLIVSVAFFPVYLELLKPLLFVLKVLTKLVVESKKLRKFKFQGKEICPKYYLLSTGILTPAQLLTLGQEAFH